MNHVSSIGLIVGSVDYKILLLSLILSSLAHQIRILMSAMQSNNYDYFIPDLIDYIESLSVLFLEFLISFSIRQTLLLLQILFLQYLTSLVIRRTSSSGYSNCGSFYHSILGVVGVRDCSYLQPFYSADVMPQC